MKFRSLPWLALLSLTTSLAGQRDLVAGFGAQSVVVDLDAATGEFGNLGVQHLDGEIFVTTRIAPAVGGLHFVTVFDVQGTKLRSWMQPGFAQSSEWGFRDGATDGSNLFFGFEMGIEIVDVDGVLQTGVGVPNIRTANGPRSVLGGLISGNVLEPDQAGITRSLAYDRHGNGGEGSFWTGNFGSSTFEIDIDGDILVTHAPVGEVKYGMGIDPLRDGADRILGDPPILWVNSAPNSSTIAEYDTATGILTGRVMDMGQNGTSVQGGLDIVPGTLGRGPRASGWDILHLQQGQPDEYRIRRLHLDVAGQGIPPSPVTRLGTREPDLLISIDDEDIFRRADRAVLNYSIDSFALNLFFDIAANPGDGMGSGGLNGVSSIIFVNVGSDADLGREVESNLLGIRELAHFQPLLTLPQTHRRPISRAGQLSNDPATPSDWRIALTPGRPFAAIGACIRAQGLYLDPDVAFLPFALTNQVRLCRGPDPIVLQGTFAEFIGANTFNATTTSGFFNVTNEETDPAKSIVALTFTIRPGDPSNSALTQQLFDNFFRWDTNQYGACVFRVGCGVCFSGASVLNTGLIFAGTPPCVPDPSVLQGWVGSDPVSSLGDFLTLDFRFTPDTFANGDVFEFDVDTDGGVGVNGNALAGVIVVVEFKDGTGREGVVMADPNNPNRAFVQL